jgi:hypothetical protein
MSRYFCTVLLAVFVLTGAFAQKRTEIRGIVTGDDNRPVPNVSVKLLNSIQGAATDASGRFRLETSEENFELRFSSVGFLPLIKSYYGIVPGSSLEVNVRLELNITSLDEFEIVFQKGPEIAYAMPNTYIFDYEMMDDNFLFLLSEKHRQKLRLVNDEDSILMEFADPYHSSQLYKDCMGNIYLVNADSAYQLYFENGKPGFLPPISSSQLNTMLRPCILAVGDNFYFEEGVLSLNASYSVINQKTSYRKVLQTIHPGSLLREREYNREQMSRQSDMGEINKDQLRYARFLQQKEWHFNSLVREQLYNPLVYARDSLYIFNHIKDSLYVFTRDGEVKRAEYIFFHKEKHWRRMTFTDEERKNVYTVFCRSGLFHLREINLATGTVRSGQKLLEHTFPEKIRIKGNYAYYLYKDKFDYWSNKNFYRQRLN